jgi:hypothetical protein
MTWGQAMREDPAVVAAFALALGTGLVLLGTVVAGLRANLSSVGNLGNGVTSGFRLRVLAVFDAARLEVAVAPLVGVALLGVTRALLAPAKLAGNLRRPAFIVLGALGAYLSFAAVARAIVLFMLLGRGSGNLLGALIQALAAVPVGAMTTAWCAGLLGGDVGYRPPPADEGDSESRVQASS